MQVMEGSVGGNQEDDLELLEGASVKPDWQVSQQTCATHVSSCFCPLTPGHVYHPSLCGLYKQKDQSGKEHLLMCLFAFLMVPQCCFWSEFTWHDFTR